MAELRHQGLFVERFETETDAHNYLAERSLRDLAHAPELWSVEPDRPVRLFCGGNLIETFHTHDEAQAFIAAREANEPALSHAVARHVRVYTIDPPPDPPAA